MKPAPFAYADPRSVDEILSLLARHGDDAKILAGGQSLVPMLNFRLARPATIVDINRVDGLGALAHTGGTLRLGALVRQRQLERWARERAPLFAAALALVGHAAIRNRGTVAGSVVHDCGKVINPLIVDGQVHGGVAQGIGGALYEEIVYDETGQLLTGSLMDYLVPTAMELPPIETVHLEHPSARNPLGIKGMGEGGAISPPAAIANAIEDALAPLGVRITETPVTPARLLALIPVKKTA